MELTFVSETLETVTLPYHACFVYKYYSEQPANY